MTLKNMSLEDRADKYKNIDLGRVEKILKTLCPQGVVIVHEILMEEEKILYTMDGKLEKIAIHCVGYELMEDRYVPKRAY